MHRNLAIDVAELAATSLYAYLLETNVRKLDASTTWLQVAVGTSVCLGFARWRVAGRQALTTDDAERIVMRSFVVGGIPIIVWQIGKAVRDKQQAFAIVARQSGA